MRHCRRCGAEFRYGLLSWRLWWHALAMPWACPALQQDGGRRCLKEDGMASKCQCYDIETGHHVTAGACPVHGWHQPAAPRETHKAGLRDDLSALADRYPSTRFEVDVMIARYCPQDLAPIGPVYRLRAILTHQACEARHMNPYERVVKVSDVETVLARQPAEGK